MHKSKTIYSTSIKTAIRKACAFALATLLCGALTAQTVNHPTFKARGSGIQNIERIERTPECTRLHVHAVFRPNMWIKIGSGTYLEDPSTGQTYRLRSAEGIELDKETYMPASGEMDYTLVFDPVPPAVQIVHYMESPGSDWNIYYLSLSADGCKQTSPLAQIQGNWYVAGNERQWVCGVYDSVTIVGNRVYANREIRKKRKQTELLLQEKGGNAQRLLRFKPQKNGCCELRLDNGKAQACTRQANSGIPGFDTASTAAQPFFRRDTAVVQGYIRGYHPLLGFSTGMVYHSNDLTREDLPTVVEINSDGSFSAKLPLSYPVENTININHGYIPFYIEPGDTLSMYVDYDDLLAASATGKRELATRHVEYMGAQAPACYLLNALSPSISLDYDELNQAITTLTPQQFGEQMGAQRTQWLHIADSVADACRLPEKAVRMLHNKAMVKAGTGLLDFVMYREYSAQQDTANLVLKAPVEDSYYNFIKEMPLDDETLPADEGFSIFINRLEYMRPLSNITMEESRAASKLFRQWSDEGILTQEKADSLFAASEQNTERRKAAYLKQLFGSKVPFCWEIAELRSYCSSLKYASTSQEVEHYTNQTRQMLTSPVLLAEMERMHQEASSEESSYMLPEGKATEVFRNIVGKYKGKVVFVDFWATTCGPCRSGIEHTVDLRKQYKGHPEFQFVYITNEEESPQKDYDEYVEKNLKGEACYRIPNSDYHYLRQLFRFNGIPHYVLVEKDGSISRKNVEAYQLEQYLKERFE